MDATPCTITHSADPPASKGMVWVCMFLLLAPILLTPEIASVLYLGVILWFSFQGPKAIRIAIRGLLKVTLFIVIPCIGALQAVNHDRMDVVRDIWYFSLPALIFLLGWMISPYFRSESRARLILQASLLLAIWWLIRLLIIAPQLSFNEQYVYRQETGGTDFILVWGCFIALEVLREWKGIWSRDQVLALATLCINTTAIVLSFSRTSYGVFGIALFFVWIPSVVGKWKRSYWFFFTAFLTVSILGMISLGQGGIGNENFRSRMSNSVSEITTTEFESMSDVTSRFRSYETIMALETYLEGNPIQLAIGQGLGTLVDLGVELDLGNYNIDLPKFQFIPIFHNGYMYLLVKTGVIGLVLFFTQIAMLWRAIPISGKVDKDASGFRMGRAILLTTLFSTFLISGPYNKGGWFSSMLLLGMLLRSASQSKERLPVLKGIAT